MDGTAPLRGRVALVTGRASGLGRAVALDLADGGAHVAIGDIDAAGSEETCTRVTAAGGSAEVVGLDVTDDGDRRRGVADLFDRYGNTFDLLVNMAGIDRPGYITDIDLADYRQVQAVDCEGPVCLTSEFMKRVQVLPEDRTADVVHIVSLSAITSGSGAIATTARRRPSGRRPSASSGNSGRRRPSCPTAPSDRFPAACRASSQQPWTPR